MQLKNKIIWGCLALIMGACTTREPEQEIKSEADEFRVNLHINTLASDISSPSEVKEKIRSLRIIMLSDGFIEYNSLIDFSEGDAENGDGKDVGVFNYLFSRATVAGNKKFYLIANEESVDKVFFEGYEDGDLPEGIEKGMSLSSLLNRFTRDKLPAQGTLGYSNSGSGTEFEEIINSVVFQPDYTETNKSVYLPYTAFYDGIKAGNNPEITIRRDMYLVPVATKFTFNFYNYRQREAEVKEIRLKPLDTSSYLMAQLDNADQTKLLDDDSYYWIDWLEKVARGSKFATDLSEYNERVGWIENYYIPENSEPVARIITSDGSDWTIEKLTDKDNPTPLTVVKYYPESRNIESKTVFNEATGKFEQREMQAYYVEFSVKEQREEETYVTDFLEIESVKALFRATHVIIGVDLYESLVEVYCEIAPWRTSNFKGYVQQEED